MGRRINDRMPQRDRTEILAERQAGECAHADTLEKFGAFTAENFAEAAKYQAERLRFHQARLLGGKYPWLKDQA
jgi:hypothetical protein